MALLDNRIVRFHLTRLTGVRSLWSELFQAVPRTRRQGKIKR
jgi:hypothetical protein